tara:strand:- start:653 stop:787 length:135 start_codon:yes stop_codon:yes gene_type:complete
MIGKNTQPLSARPKPRERKVLETIGKNGFKTAILLIARCVKAWQ